MTTRVLTGITPSGTPHLGNYVGAIRPAITASQASEIESFFFLADLHSLIKAQEPERTQRSTLEIAASWLACGLDPDKVWFYRQSDIPETTELMWFLTVIASKGILNRAHAYKAAVDKNREEQLDDDAGVSAGLFMYPVLMAADILIFKANRVPVGRDQIQHIEMARDFAQRFNHVYGQEFFPLPEVVIDEQVATLAGLDGRKMSKSYHNTIPLFAPRAELKKLVFSILTDSRAPGEPKSTEGSALFQMYQAFATPEQTAAFAQAFAEGISWGDAKQQLFERIDSEITPLRERYDALMAEPEKIEALLRRRGQQLREQFAVPLLKELRHAVGLRDLSTAGDVPSEESGAARAAPPLFKQYREKDGRFYFKLQAGDGTLLIQSEGFDSPRDAGQLIGVLKQTEHGDGLQSELFKVEAEVDVVLAALQALRE
ncbi:MULTISPECIES: tryptophan--tRNA ligase [Stenotrophomonas]|jgi:tryptophanyl-tRNA synthetase|uniref:tryptophan--tRNA ligase n=1 Tax=Stenotrophomonas TaxID=40323 RepID=UPI0008A59EDA|nr:MULTISPECIES: tryptophan--tRNA ligase [unclassified Stenotrophomonas]OFS90229.1 tryptophan--tRNA ligase [Stenotrophomonas sp. HMSC10F06]WIA60945.1 tryptophan--tRNA ligase [Stenotrophomonas sp. BIO128-Bstrain]